MEDRYNLEGHWKQIKCPFFRTDNFNSVSCEGINKNTLIRFVFSTKLERQAWQKKYCRQLGGCKECEIYKLANKKYEV